jgi:protein subunit release factor B
VKVVGRFGVTPGKEAELAARMERCGVVESDLDESFVSASGPGGQKVNRSATAVRLLHRPTGLEVKAQESRSQALNRFHARRRLCERIEARTLGNDSPEAKRLARLRKQKDRRKRRHAGGDGAAKGGTREDNL